MTMRIIIAKMVHAVAKSVGERIAHIDTMIVWKIIVYGKYSTIWLEIDLIRAFSHF